MRTSTALLGLLALLALGPGCSDDDTGQNDKENQNHGGPVQWSLSVSATRLDPACPCLDVKVEAKAQDTSGAPLAGQEAWVRTESGFDVETDRIRTGPDGKAVFRVTSHRLEAGPVTLQDDAGRVLARTELDLRGAVRVSLTTANETFVATGARADILVSVADPHGPVHGAQVLISLSPDRTEELLGPDEATTDGSGVATFPWHTQRAGWVDVTVRVGGIEDPFENLGFWGPQHWISGRVEVSQEFAHLEWPRIGLLRMDLVALRDTGVVGEPWELLSESVDLVAASRLSYDLYLPLVVPEQDFFQPEDPNYDLPEDLRAAAYAVVVYDDVGSIQGTMDASDELLAISGELPYLVFLKGTLPDEWQDLAGPNFNLAFAPLGGGFRFQSWEDWQEAMDLEVTSAPVHKAWVRGAVRFETPPASDWRVELWAAEPEVLGTDALFDPAHHQVLDSAPVTGSATTFALEFPDGAPQTPWYGQWASSLGPFVANPIVIVAYADGNGNGTYDAGETLALPHEPWGIFGPLYLYVHRGFDWILHFFVPGFHSGYLAMLLPQDYAIDLVDAQNGRFHVDPTGIPQDFDHVAFRIERRTEFGNSVLASGRDLSVDHVTGWMTTSEDLSEVQPGDWLVITKELQAARFQEVSEPVVFVVR